MKPAAWISLPTGFALALAATSFSAAVPRHAGKASSRSMASVPNLDVMPSCRQSSVPDCVTEEDFARKALVEQWPKFTRQQKARCATEAGYAGPPSYVGWLTCLTINADADKVPGGLGADADKGAAALGGVGGITPGPGVPNGTPSTNNGAAGAPGAGGGK